MSIIERDDSYCGRKALLLHKYTIFRHDLNLRHVNWYHGDQPTKLLSQLMVLS